MNIMEMGAIGELVGGVAVLVTLIYLALQVRQNTHSVQMSSVHHSNTRAADYALALAQNPDCLRAFRVGLEDPAQLADDDERLRFALILNALFRQLDDGYFQYRTGSLSPELWSGFLYTIRQTLPMRGFRMFWEARKETYTAAFVGMIDAELRRATPRQERLVDGFFRE